MIMNHPHYHSMLATKPPEYQTFVDLRKVRLFRSLRAADSTIADSFFRTHRRRQRRESRMKQWFAGSSSEKL